MLDEIGDEDPVTQHLQHLFQKILGPSAMVDLQVIDEDDVVHDNLQGQTAGDMSSADIDDVNLLMLQMSILACPRSTRLAKLHQYNL